MFATMTSQHGMFDETMLAFSAEYSSPRCKNFFAMSAHRKDVP